MNKQSENRDAAANCMPPAADAAAAALRRAGVASDWSGAGYLSPAQREPKPRGSERATETPGPRQQTAKRSTVPFGRLPPHHHKLS
ncbi:uncharacterized protein ColSpa_11750 [Colletotrichum spaethianum]|uniref:Uncharacterized protein n=1 Tax=Colletotrichum spaethianum TaxID=700344 RepID=A0AA37UKN6_9PEZI|nr:uncharacterized protein ColSpa_11750 [Colletotrichum spaethianum]GKT51569.1 hypothetical protein ColSpa_11750 [Colletotrichum spaethianum]